MEKCAGDHEPLFYRFEALCDDLASQRTKSPSYISFARLRGKHQDQTFASITVPICDIQYTDDERKRDRGAAQKPDWVGAGHPAVPDGPDTTTREPLVADRRWETTTPQPASGDGMAQRDTVQVVPRLGLVKAGVQNSTGDKAEMVWHGTVVE